MPGQIDHAGPCIAAKGGNLYAEADDVRGAVLRTGKERGVNVGFFEPAVWLDWKTTA